MSHQLSGWKAVTGSVLENGNFLPHSKYRARRSIPTASPPVGTLLTSSSWRPVNRLRDSLPPPHRRRLSAATINKLAAIPKGVTDPIPMIAGLANQTDSVPQAGARHLDGKLGSWEAGPMKTTMDLPDELIREVKLRAVVQGRTVKDLVAEFLRQGLGMEPIGRTKNRPASSMVKIGAKGLPVIRCTKNAPATRMGVAKLLALEQETLKEEDLKRARLPL